MGDGVVGIGRDGQLTATLDVQLPCDELGVGGDAAPTGVDVELMALGVKMLSSWLTSRYCCRR